MGAEGFDVHEADVARLSPFVRHHVNMPGRSCFQLPGLTTSPAKFGLSTQTLLNANNVGQEGHC